MVGHSLALLEWSHSRHAYRSAAINIQELGRTYLRYPMASGKEKLLQVEVLVDGACVHVQIQEETGKWPFYLRNHSSVPLSFYQTVSPLLKRWNITLTCLDQPTEDNRSKPRSYELLPGASLPYSFDRPSDSSKTLTLVSGSHRQEINPLEIGPQKPFAVPVSFSIFGLGDELKVSSTMTAARSWHWTSLQKKPVKSLCLVTTKKKTIYTSLNVTAAGSSHLGSSRQAV